MEFWGVYGGCRKLYVCVSVCGYCGSQAWDYLYPVLLKFIGVSIHAISFQRVSSCSMLALRHQLNPIPSHHNIRLYPPNTAEI